MRIISVAVVVMLSACRMLGLTHSSSRDERDSYVPVHADQMMFDTKPITATVPSKSRHSFTWNDHIYLRIFFTRSLQQEFELTDSEDSLHVYAVVHDQTSFNDLISIRVPKKNFGNHYVDVEIFPDPDHATQKYGTRGTASFTFFDVFKTRDDKKLDGKHRVYFGVGANGSKHERSDLIEIDFTGSSDNVLAKRSEQVVAAGDSAFASNVAIPTPGQLQSDEPKLVDEVASRARKLFGSAPIRVLLVSDEWDVERNQLTGRILGRSTGVVVLTKDTDDKCRLHEMSYQEEYTSNRFQRPGRLAGNAFTTPVVICNAAFKQ